MIWCVKPCPNCSSVCLLQAAMCKIKLINLIFSVSQTPQSLSLICLYLLSGKFSGQHFSNKISCCRPETLRLYMNIWLTYAMDWSSNVLQYMIMLRNTFKTGWKSKNQNDTNHWFEKEWSKPKSIQNIWHTEVVYDRNVYAVREKPESSVPYLYGQIEEKVTLSPNTCHKL